MKCPRCQTHNPESARFCQSCGLALTQLGQTQHCPNCQAQLPADARFCMNCGQPLDNRTPADNERLKRVVAAAPATLVDKARTSTYLTGEQRIVTALYVDIVNSTGLSERMGEENWNAVMDAALDHCCPAIYRYEGTVARLQGDELLAFFGAPVAHEDDPLRAVHAALELLDRLRRYAREIDQKHGIEFAVRISLSTGPVIIGPVGGDLSYEYSALSGPLGLAAQVESIKSPMKVLITQETYRFVAPFFDCVDLGSIDQDEQIRIYQVCGPRAGPDQEHGLTDLDSPMVGRKKELATLCELGETVRAGLGRAALIVGEPGLGKTRLIAEWQESEEAQSAVPLRWAIGHGQSHERDRVYGLLIELLRSLIGVPAAPGEPETRAALIALLQDLYGCGELEHCIESDKTSVDNPQWADALQTYASLGHLLALKLSDPALERIEHLDPQALQMQYVAAMRNLLHLMCGRQPLALVLENLQWADPSSTEMLIQLLPLVTTAPLLFCLTTRPNHDAPGWGLVSATRRALGQRLTEVTLSTLSLADSRQLIASLLQAEALPERMHDTILDKAEGNPLFLKEIVRMLIERQVISHRDGRWIVGPGIGAVQIPDNLRGLLLTRIDRLPEEAKYCLRIASIIGRQFPVQVLESVLRDEREIRPIAHLGTLESEGLIQVAHVLPELAYRFRSALVRDAAYTSILATDRQRLHLAVAETLQQLYPEQVSSREWAPVLARHFARAGDTHPLANQHATEYYSLAGEAALASYANREAERYYREALRLVSGPDRSGKRHADLLSSLGEALYRQGHFTDATETWRDGIDLYQAQDDWDSVARLYARATRATWSGGDTPGSLRLSQEGLAAVSTVPETAGLAYLVHEAARAYLLNWLPDKARPLCQQAIEMAERLGLVEVQVEALATLGLFGDLPTDAKLDALTQAVELAESSRLLSQAARAHNNLAATWLTMAGDARAAQHHYQRAAELNHTRGNTASELLSLCGAADAALRLGAFEETETAFQAMRELMGRLADPGPAAVMFHITEATLLRYQGDLERAAQMAKGLQEDARQREDRHNLIEIDCLLGDILLESCVLTGGTRGSQLSDPCTKTVENALLEAVEICKRWDLDSTTPHCLLSELRLFQGQLQDARSSLQTARDQAGQHPNVWGQVWLLWAEARVAAAAEQWTEALETFEAAAGLCSEYGMRWWWARVLQEWAQTHALRGQPTDLARARVLLREALVLFEELNVPRYAALTSEALQRVNAATHAEMLAHYGAAQELAVAGRIQESLLPAEPPALAGWQMAVTLEPARETSGDFYDFIPLSDGRWAIVIADVADKGAGAALYMALCRTLVRTYAIEHSLQPTDLFAAVNERILAETHSDMFVTAFLGMLDPADGTVTYCNAGHHPPYVLRARTQLAPATKALQRTGIPLGILESATWTQDSIQLDPGDTLVLYTDGITDAHSPEEAFYGSDRLLGSAQEHLGQSAEAIKTGLLNSVHTFVDGAPRFDDITLMIVVRER